MKLACCLAVFLFIGLANAFEEKDVKNALDREKFLKQITEECTKETGLKLDAAKKMLLGDLSYRSREAQCFVRCLFKKEGFINENDEPQIRFIVESLADSINIKKKKLNAILEICTKTKHEDPCEGAFKLLECYTRHTNFKKSDEL